MHFILQPPIRPWVATVNSDEGLQVQLYFLAGIFFFYFFYFWAGQAANFASTAGLQHRRLGRDLSTPWGRVRLNGQPSVWALGFSANFADPVGYANFLYSDGSSRLVQAKARRMNTEGWSQRPWKRLGR